MTDTFKDYCCEYDHGGKTWGFTVRAESLQDASARLRAIGSRGAVLGELVAVIPAGPGVGILVRIITWLRNMVTQ